MREGERMRARARVKMMVGVKDSGESSGDRGCFSISPRISSPAVRR